MKINSKIEFCLFTISLFFIGIGIYEILNEGLQTGKELFKPIFHFVPFVSSAMVFGHVLYVKRVLSSKN